MNLMAIITAVSGLIGVVSADLPSLLKLKALLETTSSGTTVTILQQWNADATAEDQATLASIQSWATKNNYKL